MAPNFRPEVEDSEGDSGAAVDDVVRKGEKEVYYNGYYYDVSSFLRRHPGGSVMEFYTEPGEDASQAIEQFHFRSERKVQSILRSLPRRAAKLEEVFRDKGTMTRHEQISKDFKELFEEIKKEGLFQPSIPQVILRFVEPTGLFLLSLGFIAMPSVQASLWKYMLANLAAGFAMSRFAYLSHEGGHRSLTGNPRVDHFLQDICHAFFCGGSTVWWNSQHNRHHAMPQRLQHDVDLASLPYVVFNEREVTSSSKVNKFFVKYQGFFYLTLDLFLVTLAWRFYIFPRCQLRKKAYFELLLNTFSFYLAYSAGPLTFLLISYWFAAFLALNFSLSHSHLEVADKPTHWIEYSLTHTANISPNMMIDYFMGYLNFQIEHHLFPTLPNFNLWRISGRVEELARKHGLKYRVFSYLEATRLSLMNLHNVGKNVVRGGELK